MAFTPNHLHLLVKGYITHPPKETDVLDDWFVRLVEKVRMKVIIGPNSKYVTDEGNEGLTGTVTLATSHGSIHIWDAYEIPMFQFDLYSCSLFTPEEVIRHLKEFGLVSYSYMLVDRNDTEMKIIDTRTHTIS